MLGNWSIIAAPLTDLPPARIRRAALQGAETAQQRLVEVPLVVRQRADYIQPGAITGDAREAYLSAVHNHNGQL